MSDTECEALLSEFIAAMELFERAWELMSPERRAAMYADADEAE